MNKMNYAEALARFAYTDEADFVFVRDIVKTIRQHERMIDAVDDNEVYYYRRNAFNMVEQKLDLTPKDVLENAKRLCKRICAINSAVRRTTGDVCLPRFYNLDSLLAAKVKIMFFVATIMSTNTKQ